MSITQRRNESSAQFAQRQKDIATLESRMDRRRGTRSADAPADDAEVELDEDGNPIVPSDEKEEEAKSQWEACIDSQMRQAKGNRARAISLAERKYGHVRQAWVQQANVNNRAKAMSKRR